MPNTSSVVLNTCTCISQKSRKKCKPEKRICGSWEGAIQDAKNRIAELRFSLRFFMEKKKLGDPWPGSVEARHG